MPGFSASRSDTATTPGRKTHIRFDVDEYVPQQPAWAIEREMEAIVPVYDGSMYSTHDVEFIAGHGWRLRSIHGHLSYIHETGAPTLTLTTPSGYSQKPTWVQSSMPGVLYAGAVSTSGDLFYSRDFAAGDTLTSGNYNLASDQGSFGTPVDGMTNAPMFRAGYHDSVGTVETVFSFEVKGNPKSAPDYVAGYYFNGVLGWDPNPGNYQNTGYYWIGFKGDGRCELWVYLSNGSSQKWTRVKSAWFCEPAQVHNRVHRVVISPVQGQQPSVSGGFILFRFTNSGSKIPDPPQSGFFSLLSRQASDAGEIAHWHFKFTARGVAGTLAAPAFAVRVDTRQDLDVDFQVAQTTYKTSGNLFDQLFQIPFLLDASNPFTIVFWGDFPPGCSITANIIDATTDTPPAYNLLAIRTGAGASGSTYTPVEGDCFYCVNFTFTGTGTDTPTLSGYRVFRDGVMIVSSPGEFEPAFQPTAPNQLRTSYATGPLSITLPDNEPSTANASFMIEDIAGEMPRLQRRGDFPIIIESEYDPTDPTKRVKRFRGYARLPESEEIGNHSAGWQTGICEQGPVQTFGYGTRFRVQVQCTGMWQRLEEALMPVRWNFSKQAPDSSVEPWKVTDAIRQLFYFAGYDDTQIDVPDLDARLYSMEDGDGLSVEPQASIKDLIVRWWREYYGGYLYPEPNAGTYGKWLLLQQQVPPYKFLCSFTGASPGAGKVQNSLASYPEVTITTPDGAQTMPQAPMFKRSVKWQPRPPEGNYVIGYGAQENAGQDSSGLLSAFAYNTASFRFSGFPGAAPPDPMSPDWLSRPRPIWTYLPAFASSKALDWSSPLGFAVRRIFDVSCRGRLGKTFIAPEVFVQDPVGGYMRNLRFYDAVYVEGVPCIIRSVAPHMVKDDHQMCAYSVEQLIPGLPAQVARLTGLTSYRESLQRRSIAVLSESVTSPRHLAIEKRAYGQQASTLAIGAKRTANLQNADGTFKWMLGYDQLG